jgi:hypothetical protein
MKKLYQIAETIAAQHGTTLAELRIKRSGACALGYARRQVARGLKAQGAHADTIGLVLARGAPAVYRLLVG